MKKIFVILSAFVASACYAFGSNFSLPTEGDYPVFLAKPTTSIPATNQQWAKYKLPTIPTFESILAQSYTIGVRFVTTEAQPTTIGVHYTANGSQFDTIGVKYAGTNALSETIGVRPENFVAQLETIGVRHESPRF